MFDLINRMQNWLQLYGQLLYSHLEGSLLHFLFRVLPILPRRCIDQSWSALDWVRGFHARRLEPFLTAWVYMFAIAVGVAFAFGQVQVSTKTTTKATNPDRIIRETAGGTVADGTPFELAPGRVISVVAVTITATSAAAPEAPKPTSPGFALPEFFAIIR